MVMRTARGFSALIFLLLAFVAPALAAGEGRSIVTTEGSDYFGFDLRTEQNVTLDGCKAVCLADPACRAFTYNTKAQWCFLKSDYNQLKPFNGAVAGKVVNLASDPDIGAPAELKFLPSWLVDEGRQYRQSLTSEAAGAAGLAGSTAAARQSMQSGDPRNALTQFKAALLITPDDPVLWNELARAALEVSPSSYAERVELQRVATSAAYNGYLVSRTAAVRADVLAALAASLDRRELFRPALQAYEASLSLVNSPAVRATYEDLKANKGFRIVDHSIDTDSAAPRVCAQFSEDLIKVGTDYSTFVTVDDAAPK
ncbi:PAN/Apple domain-containing protein, partial [Rhizobiaceae sp. 2RAB30]